MCGEDNTVSLQVITSQVSNTTSFTTQFDNEAQTTQSRHDNEVYSTFVANPAQGVPRGRTTKNQERRRAVQA